MSLPKPMLVVLACLVFIDCSIGQTPTPVLQKTALMAVYYATGGANWTQKWTNTSSDPCADFWYGVRCTGNNIYALILKNNNLVGTLPDELGLLSTLQFLYLSENSLSGTFPSRLASLQQVQQLGLDANKLTGNIPPLNMQSLQNLFLQDNNLTGGLDSLSGLKTLQYAYLSRNQITGTIPEGLGNIASLQQLGVDSNKLTGTIPENFGIKQSFFQSFFAQDNQLTGHFNENLCRAQNCDCSGNTFSCPIPQPPCCRVSTCSKK